MTLGNWNATSSRALPPRWGRFRPQCRDNDVAQRKYSHRFQLFRLGSLSATISILKIFLMVLTMKIEEVKKRIGLFGLEDSQFTDNLLLIEELGFRINDVGNSDA